MSEDLNDGFGDDWNTNLLIQGCTGWLMTVARDLVGARGNLRVEDLVQEGRIEMWRAISEHDPGKGDLRPWMLFRARRRMGGMAFRDQPQTGHTREVGRPEVKVVTSVEEQVSHYEGGGEDVVAMIFGLVDSIEGVEIAYHQGEILAAVAALTPKQRTYVYARFWCGMDPTDGMHMNPGMRAARAANPITRRDVLWTGNKTTTGAKERLAEALAHLAGAL